MSNRARESDLKHANPAVRERRESIPPSKARGGEGTTRPVCRISIDPGQEIGLAIWEESTWSELVMPIHTDVFTCGRPEWQLRVNVVVGQLLRALENYDVRYAFIEYPAFHQSLGGQVTAETGSLVKLCIATGIIAEAVTHATGATIIYVPVADWKGQMSKDAVAFRIRKRLGEKAHYPSHANDAVGIGLHMKGLFHAT